MIKETIIRMGALIQCSLKGEANSKGRLFEGKGEGVLIRPFAIFQLSPELSHSEPGVPYLFFCYIWIRFLLILLPKFIDHTPLCINEQKSSHKRFRWSR